MKNRLLYRSRTFLSENSYPILLLLFCIWACVGIFPLYCYESDSMHTIAGCSILYNQGFTLPPVYSYEYSMQPLVYYLVAGCRCLIPVLTCEQIFCLLTGISSLLFVVVSVRLIHRLTNIRKEIILLGFFLIPESVAIGMYPNTAILAVLPFACALNSLLDKHLRTALVWMCFAPLFRVDILMVYPVVLPLFLWQGDAVATALKKSLVCALTVVAATVLGYWLLQANPLVSTLGSYSRWNEEISLKSIFFALYTFYTPLSLLFIPISVCTLYRRKEFRLLAVVFLPMLLNHIVYARMGCATKHYLYILPFVALLTAVALATTAEWLKGQRLLARCTGLVLLLYLFVAIRFCPSSRPWYAMPQGDVNVNPFLCLFSEQVTPLKASFGIGAGFCMNTYDEKMIACGYAFYPFFIHNLKQLRLDKRKKASEYLSGKQEYHLVGYDHESMIAIPLVLQGEGYSMVDIREKELRYLYLENGKGMRVTVPVVLAKNSRLQGTPDERIECLREHLLSLKPVDVPVYFFPSNSSLEYICDQLISEKLVEKIYEGLYQIHLPNQ